MATSSCQLVKSRAKSTATRPAYTAKTLGSWRSKRPCRYGRLKTRLQRPTEMMELVRPVVLLLLVVGVEGENTTVTYERKKRKPLTTLVTMKRRNMQGSDPLWCGTNFSAKVARIERYLIPGNIVVLSDLQQINLSNRATANKDL